MLHCAVVILEHRPLEERKLTDITCQRKKSTLCHEFWFYLPDISPGMTLRDGEIICLYLTFPAGVTVKEVKLHICLLLVLKICLGISCLDSVYFHLLPKTSTTKVSRRMINIKVSKLRTGLLRHIVSLSSLALVLSLFIDDTCGCQSRLILHFERITCL